MRLWRINLKPGSGDPGVDGTEFCVREKVVGIGWRVDPVPSSPEEYLKLGEQRWCPTEGRAWKAAVGAFLKKMESGDLIWTRNRKGAYYLGRIAGPWEYREGKGHLQTGIVNVRRCDWARHVEMDAVPGSVITSFIPRATVQAVNNKDAQLYSRFLFARLCGEPFTPEPGEQSRDVLELLSPADLEDVAAVYLQAECGYVMFPSTCKRDAVAVECILASVADGRRVGLQVKSGDDVIDRDTYRDFDGTVYLFQVRGLYKGQPDHKCVCLGPEAMRAFVHQRREIMPTRIQRWLEYAEEAVAASGRSGGAV